MTIREFIEEIELVKEIMISVSTGGVRIQEVNEEYKQKYRRINRKFCELELENPNPYTDLWRWHHKWSSGDLPTYSSRREYISEMFDQLIIELSNRSEHDIVSSIEPTGWARVDRNIERVSDSLEIASNEEDFQSIGLLCREAIISLAQAVYDQNIHRTRDGVIPSNTDANRMLEAYISTELSGSSNVELRKFIRSALGLANALQHRRTATFRDAAMCVTSTNTLVNLIAILSGRCNP